MPQFIYRALDTAGKPLKGTLHAATEKEALTMLRERAIYPLLVRAYQPLSLSLRNWLRFGRQPRIANNDLAAFTRQLATLLEATIPYDAALRMVETETDNSVLKNVLSDVRGRVVEGAFLADALASHPRYFPPMVVNMVRSGENSGTLSLILERLASHYENINRLRNKVTSALVYPTFMLIFSTAVVLFMVTNIIPKITRLLTNFGGVLPLPTRILIAISNVLINYWWLLLLLLIAAIWGITWFLRTETGAVLKDRLELALPVWRVYRRKLILQRFSETLATMLKSGVELGHALAVTAEVVENRQYLRAMDNVMFDIQNRGSQLAAALRRTGMFPEDVCQMVAIGEETSTMDVMLENVAVRLSQEITTTMDAATSLFEPIMILIMGAMVGFIVVSILLPMLQLNQLVG